MGPTCLSRVCCEAHDALFIVESNFICFLELFITDGIREVINRENSMLVKNTKVNFTYYNMTVLNLFSLWEINVLMGSSRCVCLWLSVGPSLLLLISAAFSLLRRPGPSVVALRMGLLRLPAGACSVCLLLCLSDPWKRCEDSFWCFPPQQRCLLGVVEGTACLPHLSCPVATFLQEHVAPCPAGEMALWTNRVPVH